MRTTRALTALCTLTATVAVLVAGSAGLAPERPAPERPAPERPAPGVEPGTLAVQRAGIIRWDPAVPGWSVLDTPTHIPAGVTGVSCSAATGRLTVTMVAVGSLSGFQLGGDEVYAGRFDFGASAGLDKLIIVIRRPSTGAVVDCDDPALRLAGSNFQVSVTGWE
jgi:hypothetical protein